MKKFALGILSVFLIFGGMILTACKDEVNLSVSTEEVTIYTNDSRYDSEAVVNVSVENSSMGIGVNILSGDGIVKTEQAKRADGDYYVTIQGIKSGDAEIEIYSQEDYGKKEKVSVHVNTILTNISQTSQGTSTKSDKFAVKGVWKELNVEDYFDLYPAEANIRDIRWSFVNGTAEDDTKISQNGEIVAQIEGDKLFVSEDFQATILNLKVTAKDNANATSTVAFEVLENSQINSMVVGGELFFEDGQLINTKQTKYELKYNDFNRSTTSGSFVVNTAYDVELDLVVFDAENPQVALSKEEYSKYFMFSAPSASVGANNTTCNFDIVAQNSNLPPKTFYVFFKVCYSDFDYEILIDQTNIVFDFSYTVKNVEIRHENNTLTNNYSVDVFSHYNSDSGYGYQLSVLLKPDDVTLDNDMFRISVDVSQVAGATTPDDFILFYNQNGTKLKFERTSQGSSTFTLTMRTGSVIYVLSNSSVNLQDVVVNFVSVGNPENAKTALKFNLYHISEETNLDMEVLEPEQHEDFDGTYYTSSSNLTDAKKTFKIKINGLSTANGLVLKHSNNSKFSYGFNDSFEVVEENELHNYIIVNVEISLEMLNFNDFTSFWFEHSTGKTTVLTTLEAFVPMTQAYVENLSKSSVDVFVSQDAYQDFVLSEGKVVSNGKGNSSLAKVVLEAGSTISLSTVFGNATLSDFNVSYKHLPFSDTVSWENYENIFNDVSSNLNVLANNFDLFKDGLGTFMSINNNKQLMLTDNPTKQYIAVLFNGFDENHNLVTYVRFFAVESFYSVTSFTTNYRKVSLYSAETLSIAEIENSYANISISLRNDIKIPTYASDLSLFTFESALFGSANVRNADWSVNGNSLSNGYYTISYITRPSESNTLNFRITANSTNLLPSFVDYLKVYYTDNNNNRRETEIQIIIQNVKRVEKLTWVNKTEDEEIYLDTTAPINSADRRFAMDVNVSPSDSKDLNLKAKYIPTFGSENDITVTINKNSMLSYKVDVTLNTQTGDHGYLYLLPNDMIKMYNGNERILVYKYAEDENGNVLTDVMPVPYYISLNDLTDVYDNLINGCEDYSNYFVNNDGEKIYYRDVIVRVLMTLADGSSEETALRIYDEESLKNINTGNYFYRIMNDITLHGWNSLGSANDGVFNGTIFGKTSNTTLHFTNSADGKSKSQAFINVLGGTVKDLTFTGVVENAGYMDAAGFVANVNKGTLNNVVVDVYFEDGSYKFSTLNSSAIYTGGLVGLNENNGLILNSYNFGMSINSTYNATTCYTGGLVGQNAGVVRGSGVEFYTFSGNVINKISANSIIGGLVGWGRVDSVIEKSYAYAYPLETYTAGVSVLSNGTAMKGAFIGRNDSNVIIRESFAFLGANMRPTNSVDGQHNARIFDSYLSYKTADSAYSIIYSDATVTADKYFDISGAVLLSLSDVENQTDRWTRLINETLNSSIWQLSDIDSGVNFGFMYLKETQQSASVDVNDLFVADNTDPYKSIYAGATSGILFFYSTQEAVSSNSEIAALNNLNTLSVSDLFNLNKNGNSRKLTASEARSLLPMTNSNLVSVGTGSVRLKGVSLETVYKEVTISMHSRMNFDSTLNFTFLIVNALPQITKTVDGQELKDNQTLLIQMGSENVRTINNNYNRTLYLNGNPYTLVSDDYEFGVTLDGVAVNVNSGISNSYVTVRNDVNAINLVGKQSTEDASNPTLVSWLALSKISGQQYIDALKNHTSTTNQLSVYKGATSLVISKQNLKIEPDETENFTVDMASDNSDDNISISVVYDNFEIKGVQNQTNVSGQNFFEYEVDSHLTLEIYWTKQVLANGNFRFNVGVNVKEENRHLIEFDYENLKIKVSALSQINNVNFPKREINLSVGTQPVDDVAVQVYDIEMRQIRNSTLYMRPSNNTTNTVAPSTDMLVAVSISPAFAKMTHFTLTYEVSTSNPSDDGKTGSLSISKMLYNENYGYYIDTTNTNIITNGVKVNLTEDDKQGNGVYYFRVYVSSAFTANSTIKFFVNYYYEDEKLNQESFYKELRVEYLKEATVEVEGSSLYTLARGARAKVSVTVALDQELNSLYLTNNLKNLSLTTPTMEIVGNSKIYTAYVNADVDATLIDGSHTGVFYVCATVERIVNNKVQEIKESRATICLVDFAIEKEEISVSGNGGTTNYGGLEFDVFRAYVNAKNVLSFDYPVLPESYTNYDPNNSEETDAVAELMKKRQEFALRNSYKDDISNYYINYIYNASTLSYSETRLIQQIYLVENFVVGPDVETNDKRIVSDVSTKIYNDQLGQPVQRSNYFDVVEEDASVGNVDFKNVNIVGKLTGSQLMKLQTTIYIQGKEFVWDYYFVISVEIWSDEETPTTIYNAEEFVNYLTKSEQPDDYILMADIELNDYQPIDTSLIDSLDGNGFTINLNSFKKSTEDSALTLALFTTVQENTLLKNVRVNIYQGGQINVNIRQYQTVNIAGFAIENLGIIYNCEVVSYYDQTSEFMTANSGETGLFVQYTDGNNTDPIILTADILNSTNYALNSSTISGFVENNSGSIVNSRVGGDAVQRIVEISGLNYIQSENLGTFTILGQGDVAGFVNTNSGSGFISACFADNVQIYNRMNSITSKTAGFALNNSNSIQTSYVEGVRVVNADQEDAFTHVITGSSISARGIVGGFIYENGGTVENCYSNIAIDNTEMTNEYGAGFVYRNLENAIVRLCYTACSINAEDINQMQFSGVYNATSQNFGVIESSYYYATSMTSDTNQKRIEPSVLAVDDVVNIDSFYGFSFSSYENAYDGIWKINLQTGIGLVSANEKALSNRYAVTTNGVTSVFYSNHITDLSTMNYVNLSYGSKLNPIIIRSAAEFAKATGKATSKEISSFKEFYDNTRVFGNYRLVKNIDLSELENEEEKTTLTTTSKTFTGILDGNGFTISGIELGSEEEIENYGLFAKLNGASIMGLKLEVVAVNNTKANIVGTLAGTVIDSRVCSIQLTVDDNSNSSVAEEKMIAGQNVVGGLFGMVFGDSKLSDISVSGVEVFSSYSDDQKTIKTNSVNTGDNLRRYVDSNSALKPFVKSLSYAGAVAGYVDIYDGSIEFASINLSYGMSDYNVITIHVNDSVNIYAEVTGGLFGYVGKTTLIYDAVLELNSPMDNSNPSYIISRNLYAGGLIGENYGGMFAVSASYEKNLQDMIEENQNGYYSAVNSSNQRGQTSIFSYSASGLDDEELKKSRANDPLFIGGLVGYMGGGFIYVGYNKLNVVVNETTNFCRHTLAAGGIIGYVAKNDNSYSLTFAENNPKANLALHDVYASGDVYIENSVEKLSSELAKKGVGSVKGNYSAGIIGAKDREVVLGFKNVNAVNYYSFNSNNVLTGDKVAEINDNVYTSDRHFTFIGSVLSWNGSNTNGQLIQEETSSNIYFITNQSFYAEAVSGLKAQNGTMTVGGYTTVNLNGITANIQPFGFNYAKAKVQAEDGTETILDKSAVVVDIDHIGNPNMKSMSVAYSTFNSFFVKRGWNANYWQHKQDKLFPQIELHPQTNLLFWDAWNTKEILETIKNGQSNNLTIVLRGKENKDENDKTYVDINLTSTNVDIKEIDQCLNGFSGTLISYYAYTGTHEEGTVKKPITGGGEVDADVGIVMDHSILVDIAPTAKIQGITFYMSPSKNKTTIDYQITDNEANGLKNVIFKDVKVVLNKPLTLKAKGGFGLAEGEYGTGVFANYADATTFEGILFDSSRLSGLKNDDGSSVTDITLTSGDCTTNSYLGLLVGKLEQTSLYDTMVMSSVSFKKIEGSNVLTTSILFNNEKSENVYMGLYAGEMSRKAGTFTVGLAQFGKIDINISSSKQDSSIYVGAYSGKLTGVENVTMISNEDVSDTNIVIKQNSTISNLFAGLGFGYIDSNVNIQSKIGKMVISGGIYQVDNASTGFANIGGFAGKIGGSVSIGGLSLNFNVGKFVDSSKDISGEFNDYYNFKSSTDNKATTKSHVDLFEENLYKYNTTYPYVITGTSNDNAVGGYIGYQNVGGVLTISGQAVDIAGVLDVKAKFCNVGGMVGKAYGTVNITADGTSNLDISVSDFKDGTSSDASLASAQSKFNVGGLIGNIATSNSVSDFKVNIKNAISYNILGNTISNAHEINYGGAVGVVERTDWNNSNRSIVIENVTYGGALKIYENISGSVVNVGGMVGLFDLGNAGETGELADDAHSYKIYGCKTYGDVFVMYPKAVEENGSTIIYDNSKLNTYNFGGIVGSASYIVVQKCSSLMTSFNSKFKETTASTNVGNYNVNAIVGSSSGIVSYSQNKYSSGVNLAYQTENGNVDSTYDGNTATYNGFVGLRNTAGNTSANILDDFKGLTSGDGKAGTKLRPQELGSTQINTSSVSKSHGISWFAFKEEKTINNPIFGQLQNAVIVGNSNTITFEEKNGTTHYDISSELNDKQILTVDNNVAKYGSLVNVIGNNKAYTGNSVDFTVVSGLLMNLQINGANYGDRSYNSVSFGGVVGEMYGNSIVYGVGVNGTLSVGGGKIVNLGGLVGTVRSGMIQECFTDVDMIYRGTSDGFASGVANVNDYNSLIRTTYSSGQIESYVDANIYTFAYLADTYNDTNIKKDLLDVYSVTQVKRTDALSTGTMEKPISFINDRFTALGQVVHNCDEVSDGTNKKTIFSLGYDKLQNGEIFENNSIVAESSSKSLTDWYFTPYTNYGFASHGFGYLKNTTTYTRDKNGSGENALDVVNQDGTYAYTTVDYSELIDTNGNNANTYQNDWYLAVLNSKKFNDMIISKMPYKYLLKYDVNIIDENYLDIEFNPQDDNKLKEFVLDGNRKTLTFKSETKPLFNSFTGTIENLRIINEKTNNSSDKNSFGILARTMTNGKLKNITVIGNIQLSAEKIGGVVGSSVNSEMENIESIVNITNSASASFTGGVVGYSQNTKLSVVSNAGIIQNVSENQNTVDDINIRINGEIGNNNNDEHKVNEVRGGNISLNSVTGGLVGYMVGGSVTDSYNVNAVLANYTKDKTQNAVAGGIVGYVDNGTISKSYNTGMVGVGNFANNGTDNKLGYSVAGGIFGYGTAEFKIEKCFNDAKVEALGTGSTNAVYKKLASGDPEIKEYTNVPVELIYKVTTVYNEGLLRKVFAYGLGYAPSVDGSNISKHISNSGTSTDNILNDGVIGQKIKTQDLIFERKKILGNDENHQLSYGKYLVDEKLYVNGIDSYGFATRVYMKDTITRAYQPNGDIEDGKYKNAILESYYHDIPQTSGADYMIFGYYFYKNKAEKVGGTGRGDYYEYNSSNITNLPNISTDLSYGSVGLTLEDIGMACDTEYYSSVTFESYDELLKELNVLPTNETSYKNVDSIIPEGSSSTISGANKIIENFVNKIDKARKINIENFVDFNVAGQSVAVVYNKDNINDVYSPFRVTAEFTLNVENMNNQTINAEMINLVDNSGKLNKFVIEDIANEGNQYKITAELFFNAEVSNVLSKIEVYFEYERIESVILAKNTVIHHNNDTYILLTDMVDSTNSKSLHINMNNVNDLQNVTERDISKRRNGNSYTFNLNGETYLDIDVLRYASNDKTGSLFTPTFMANGEEYEGAYLLIKGNHSFSGEPLNITHYLINAGEIVFSKVTVDSKNLNTESGNDHFEYNLINNSTEKFKDFTFKEKEDKSFSELDRLIDAIESDIDGTLKSYRYDIVNSDGTSEIGATSKSVIYIDENHYIGFDGTNFIGKGGDLGGTGNQLNYHIDFADGTIYLYKVTGTDELAIIVNTADILNFIANHDFTFSYTKSEIASSTSDFNKEDLIYYDNYFNVYQNVILGNKENFEFNKQNQAVFTGENFAEYAQTVTNNNSVTVGGITFYEVTETFEYTPSHYYLEYKNTNFNEVGYEYKVYDNGEIIDIGFGKVDNKSDNVIELKNIKQGRLEVYLTNTNLNGVYDHIEHNELDYPLTSSGSKEEVAYSYKSNLYYWFHEKNPLYKSEDYYFETGADRYEKDGDIVGYNRTIYCYEDFTGGDFTEEVYRKYIVFTSYYDGTLTVEYYAYNYKLTEKQDDEIVEGEPAYDVQFDCHKNSKKFIYKNGKMFVSDIKAEYINTVDRQEIIIDWMEPVEMDKPNFDVFNRYSLDKDTTLELKYISSSIRNTRYTDSEKLEIVFARTDANQSLNFECSYLEKKPPIETEYKIEKLTENYQYEDTTVRDNPNYSNLTYREKDGNNEFLIKEDGVISAGHYYETEYEKKYNARIEVSNKEVLQESGSGAGQIDNIIVAANIYLQDENVGYNTKNIIGNNYLFKMNSTLNSHIFVNNTNKIKDMIVISNVSLRSVYSDSKNVHSAFTKNENAGILDNVSLYGNMRNISNMTLSNVSPIKTASNKVKEVNSYLTINGLDAIVSGQEVKSNISDATVSTYKDGTYNNHNILIAGNGANGKNGTNGLSYSYRPDELDGGSETNGSSGGTSGGNIVVASGFNGIARAGHAGIGGYGGDGGHALSSYNVNNKGGLGRIGSTSGVNGTVKDNNENIVSSLSNRIIKNPYLTEDNQINDSNRIKNFSGNDGIGTFGVLRAENNNLTYTSSSFYSSEITSKDMVQKNDTGRYWENNFNCTWGSTDKNFKNYSTTIGAYANKYCTEFKSMGDIVDHSYGIRPRFHNDARGGIMKNCFGYNYGGSLGQKIHNENTDIDYYVVRKLSHDENGVVWTRSAHSFRKVLWTSGEFINKASAGNFTGQTIQ